MFNRLVLVTLLGISLVVIGCAKDVKSEAQAVDGKNGKDGANGLNGKDGTNGAKGDTGLQGAKGATGAQGIAGKDGINGKDGMNGVTGAQGVAGKDGMNGHSIQIFSADTATCENGGLLLITYIDLNANGIYDSATDKLIQKVSMCTPKCTSCYKCEDDDSDHDYDDNGSEKVYLCHKASSKWLTLKVSQSAVSAHLNHGDYLGKCK